MYLTLFLGCCVFYVIVTGLSDSGCPSTLWQAQGLHCYLIKEDPTDYDTAWNKCISFGGKLASIWSGTEFDYVWNLINTTLGSSADGVWLGLHTNGRYWYWQDGSDSTYYNWKSHADKYAPIKGDSCISAAMAPPDGSFEAYNCSESASGYVCKESRHRVYQKGFPWLTYDPSINNSRVLRYDDKMRASYFFQVETPGVIISKTSSIEAPAIAMDENHCALLCLEREDCTYAEVKCLTDKTCYWSECQLRA